MRKMIIEDAFNLFKTTSPFSFLDDTTLKAIAKEMLLEFHPKGHATHHQNGPATEHLSIIKS